MSRRGAAISLVTTLALVTAAGCAGDEGPTTGSTGPGTTISIDSPETGPLAYPAYRDPSAPIYVALGRRFALQLDTEAGEGFSWQVANEPDPAVVVPLGTQFRSEDPGVPGAPTVQYLSFAASGVGTTTIELHLVSPSGEVVPHSFPLVFTVVVTFTGDAPPPPPDDTTPPDD